MFVKFGKIMYCMLHFTCYFTAGNTQSVHSSVTHETPRLVVYGSRLTMYIRVWNCVCTNVMQVI